VTYDGRGLKFGTVAEEYDQFRPGPPSKAREIAGDLTGLKVLDVGAGTGKLTRFLLALGADVSVIEPDDAMRAVLTRRSPEVAVLLGAAESVPADDQTFDAVFSSSAWHWFAQPDATNEFARVLRDDGAVQIWWNGFGRDTPWMDELTKLRERRNDVGARPRGWHATFELDGPFYDVDDFDIDWTWTRSVEEVVGNFFTFSAAIMRTEEERAEMAVQVRDILTKRFADGPVELPMSLRGTSARRRPRAPLLLQS
jgi:SAM-dependent methyltransferase